ncbi:hypothetical protein B1J93_00940 [Leptospira kirschneri serovar Pomona]|uniref:Uncharacterized protein n=1 Tax=Leptospira kirschneri serovar Pomona TaxID=561005 RepID=A0A1T1E3E2_9LEPT|nr:hypothetical protein [Leptospira kirschneri]OOV47587.1 hypothetical protein B1J93_00940 [Leptospira kirschneri serovar Pomona]
MWELPLFSIHWVQYNASLNANTLDRHWLSFSKSMSSYVSKLICKIMTCSSHILGIDPQNSDPTFFRKMNHKFLT